MMPRSRALTVEDIPDLVDAIVLALERRGMLPSGKSSSLGLEDIRCDKMENEFMDPTDTATAGGSSSLEAEAAKRLSRFRRRQTPNDTRPLCRKRSKGEP